LYIVHPPLRGVERRKETHVDVKHMIRRELCDSIIRLSQQLSGTPYEGIMNDVLEETVLHFDTLLKLRDLERKENANGKTVGE